MAKKKYDLPIDKNIAWGGDETTGFLPVAGNRVLEFIKNTLSEKIGYLHYDSDRNQYLAFADEDSRNKYYDSIDEAERAKLLLGAFNAPYEYSAEIHMESATNNSVLFGKKGNNIVFTFDTKNKQGISIGENVICNYTINAAGAKTTITKVYKAGTVVELNIDKYLKEGVNRIGIVVQGQDTAASTGITVVYNVINLTIEDDTEYCRAYLKYENPNQELTVPYTIKGNGIKSLEWFIDGEKVGDNDIIEDVTASRVKFLSITTLSHGKHTLQYRASIKEGDSTFYSEIMYREFFIDERTDFLPMIGVCTTLPSGSTLLQSNLSIPDAEQFTPYSFDIISYNPLEATTDLTVSLDDTTITSISNQNGDITSCTFIPSEYGLANLQLLGNDVVYNIPVKIKKSSINIQDITDGLLMSLSALGRNNSAADKDVWTYNTVNSNFTGFKWNEISGWNKKGLYVNDGASVNINYIPLNNPTAYGSTLEFEFETVNVNDDNAIICDLTQNGTGIKITASEATLTASSGDLISVKFKGDENIRVAFVISKSNLAYIYINGIMSGAMYYSSQSNFNSNKTITFTGSEDAEIIVKHLRFYNTELTSDQILNNFIKYRPTAEEMLEIYNRNDIYEEGSNQFSIDTLTSQLPVMIITGDIPTLEATNNKNTLIVVKMEYINLQDPTKSFTIDNAVMTPQGTSSLGYPKKNFRHYTTKRDDTVLTVNGKVVEDRLYSFKDKAIPVNCWCEKADYAESSSTHNTGIARLWNTAMKNAQINGEYVLRTNAQKAAANPINNYKYDVRTTVDGFPILMFYRQTENHQLIFMGKYNFNNDKSTENVFGFKDIPGFDSSNVECWEVLDNGSALALFTEVENFDTKWKDSYESRYPGLKTPDTTNLKRLVTWLASTKNNLEEFKTNKGEYLDLYKVAAYYIYIMRFGAVDQVVKNTMLTTEDGLHWYFINYDNDTVMGVRNDGVLSYPPNIDRLTRDGEAYAYAGHDSVLWNNLENDPEFMRLVVEVDNALYNSGISYNNVINTLNTEQSSKWCERIYNRDAQYKYIEPFKYNAINNLFMLQGSRAEHRKWWLSRRFNLIDSKFVTGEYKSGAIEIKLAAAPPGLTFSITSGYDNFYGYGTNNNVKESGIYLNRHESHTFTTVDTINVGDPIRIYNSANIEELNLCGLTPYITQLNLSNAFSKTLGTKLKTLKLGQFSETQVYNDIIENISGIGVCSKLENFDISGYRNIKALDLSSLTQLKTFKAKNSNITTVTFPQGSNLNTIELPNTMTSLELRNLPLMTFEGISLQNMHKLKRIVIKKCPLLTNSYQLINKWKKDVRFDSTCYLELENIKWEGVDAETLITLGKLGKDNLKLTGTIKLVSCTLDLIAKIKEVFGENCFSSTNSLTVTGPNDLFLIGPTELTSGETGEYQVVLFSTHPGTVRATIEPAVEGINVVLGSQNLKFNVTSDERDIDRTVNVKVVHTPQLGQTITKNYPVKFKKLILPNYATIDMEDTLIIDDVTPIPYDAIVTPKNVDDVATCQYEISLEGIYSGDLIVPRIEVYAQNTSNQNRYTVKALLHNLVYYTIKFSVRPKEGHILFTPFIAEKTFITIEKGVMITSLSNPKLLAHFYSKNYCQSNSKMYIVEAEEVLGTLDLSPIASSQYNNPTDFDCLKYFTNVDTVIFPNPTSCYVTRLSFPPNSTNTLDLRFEFVGTDNNVEFPEGCSLKTVTLTDYQRAISTGKNLLSMNIVVNANNQFYLSPLWSGSLNVTYNCPNVHYFLDDHSKAPQDKNGVITLTNRVTHIESLLTLVEIKKLVIPLSLNSINTRYLLFFDGNVKTPREIENHNTKYTIEEYNGNKYFVQDNEAIIAFMWKNDGNIIVPSNITKIYFPRYRTIKQLSNGATLDLYVKGLWTLSTNFIDFTNISVHMYNGKQYNNAGMKDQFLDIGLGDYLPHVLNLRSDNTLAVSNGIKLHYDSTYFSKYDTMLDYINCISTGHVHVYIDAPEISTITISKGIRNALGSLTFHFSGNYDSVTVNYHMYGSVYEQEFFAVNAEESPIKFNLNVSSELNPSIYRGCIYGYFENVTIPNDTKYLPCIVGTCASFTGPYDKCPKNKDLDWYIQLHKTYPEYTLLVRDNTGKRHVNMFMYWADSARSLLGSHIFNYLNTFDSINVELLTANKAEDIRFYLLKNVKVLTLKYVPYISGNNAGMQFFKNIDNFMGMNIPKELRKVILNKVVHKDVIEKDAALANPALNINTLLLNPLKCAFNLLYYNILDDFQFPELDLSNHACIFVIDKNWSSTKLETRGNTEWIKGKRMMIPKNAANFETDSIVCNENNSAIDELGNAISMDSEDKVWVSKLPKFWYRTITLDDGRYIVLMSDVAPNLGVFEGSDTIPEYEVSDEIYVGVTKLELNSAKTDIVLRVGGLGTYNIWYAKWSLIMKELNIKYNSDDANVTYKYNMISFKTHCKLCMMAYAKYGNTDLQRAADTNGNAIFGFGSTVNNPLHGYSTIVGNRDGRYNTSTGLFSMFGLENPWSGLYEFMSGVHLNNGTVYLYDGCYYDQVPPVEHRVINTPFTGNGFFMSLIYGGKYFDMIPMSATEGSDTTYFADCCWSFGYSGWHVLCRSGERSSGLTGLAFLDGLYGSGSSYSFIGSRLQIEIIPKIQV